MVNWYDLSFATATKRETRMMQTELFKWTALKNGADTGDHDQFLSLGMD